MKNKKILEVINDSLFMENSRISLVFDNVHSKEEAEKLIANIANKLGRTYQYIDYTDNKGWYEIVNHDNDRLEIAVYNY